MGFFEKHYGLLLSLAGGAVFGILGAYADKQRDRAEFFNDQADTLSDGLVIARQSLYNCPKAAELIDKDINERHPDKNNAPVIETLRYISKKAGVKCEQYGDDWPDSKKVITKKARWIQIGE